MIIIPIILILALLGLGEFLFGKRFSDDEAMEDMDALAMLAAQKIMEQKKQDKKEPQNE